MKRSDGKRLCESIGKRRRRHLEISQRAAIPVKSGILEKLEDEARERMSQGAKGTEKIPDPSEARHKAAEMFLVNPHYISNARQNWPSRQ
jgi:hypothetical protein